MKKLINTFVSSVLRYFVQGLFYIVPIAATLYVILKIFNVIDGILKDQLPIHIPGFGILVIFSGISVLGFLGSFLITTPIKNVFFRILDKAPLIKTIYSAIEDLLEAFVGKKKGFNVPVIVRVSKENEIWKPGFITQDDLSFLHDDSLDNPLIDKITVYLPHSYAFSGNLLVVSRSNVYEIKNINSADYMKFIVSGGVAKPN